MATMIPLIRAACLIPHIHWLESRNRPVDAHLAEAGVPGDPVDQPERPIPLRAAMTFVRDAADREDIPDLGLRVMTGDSLSNLGAFGRVVMSGATVEAALQRAERAMPHFCTHERIELRGPPGGRRIVIAFSIGTDPAALHQAQLMSLGHCLSLLALARHEPSGEDVIQMVPHPRYGFDGLPAELRDRVSPSPDSLLVLGVDPAALALPLVHLPLLPETATPAPDWRNLRLQAEFQSCASMLIEGMIEDGNISVERLAEAAAVSVRTLQRRLAAEGNTFSSLVDAARRRAALAAIVREDTAIADVASAVGYASPSALTRAVRRWVGHPPRALRMK
ncbi:MAG: helix-turn-helix domain-containing protein [Mangrovicoccus sp.]|nr:helix-turn-helix domain-containing protein [Mangrovicoccus sp.]